MTADPSNSGLSFVFLEAVIRPAYAANLDPLAPEKIWDEALCESDALPDEVTLAIIEKKSEVSLSCLKAADITLPPQRDYCFAAHVVTFNDAASAESFHKTLSAMLERYGMGHAFREGAVLNENGALRKIGFQL